MRTMGGAYNGTMKRIPPQRQIETIAGRIAASHEMVAFSFRKASDAFAEFGFAVNCALETDDAKRSSEVADAALSRARKPQSA